MGVPVQISDGARIADIDPVTHALETISYEHHEIHSGTTYRVDLSEDALGNGNSLTLDFLTPADGRLIHFTSGVATGNIANLTIWEDVEVSSNGNAVTPINANRSVGENSSMQFVFTDSTVVTTNATQLNLRRIGAAAAGNPQAQGTGGVLTAARPELVLKPNTWYSLMITNICGVTQAVWLGADWYEHTSKK